MNTVLPDLKLRPMPEWTEVRREWMALAESCLYGHAPEKAECACEVVNKEELWQGRGTRETLRICYGPDRKWSFDAVLLSPSAPGTYPAITWNQFSSKDWESCPCEDAVVNRGLIIAGFEREPSFRRMWIRTGLRAPAFPGAARRRWRPESLMSASVSVRRCVPARAAVDASGIWLPGTASVRM